MLEFCNIIMEWGEQRYASVEAKAFYDSGEELNVPWLKDFQAMTPEFKEEVENAISEVRHSEYPFTEESGPYHTSLGTGKAEWYMFWLFNTRLGQRNRATVHRHKFPKITAFLQDRMREGWRFAQIGVSCFTEKSGLRVHTGPFSGWMRMLLPLVVPEHTPILHIWQKINRNEIPFLLSETVPLMMSGYFGNGTQIDHVDQVSSAGAVRKSVKVEPEIFARALNSGKFVLDQNQRFNADGHGDQVAGHIKVPYIEGKLIVFDDFYAHSVENDGGGRVVLWVDLCKPHLYWPFRLMNMFFTDFIAGVYNYFEGNFEGIWDDSGTGGWLQ